MSDDTEAPKLKLTLKSSPDNVSTGAVYRCGHCGVALHTIRDYVWVAGQSVPGHKTFCTTCVRKLVASGKAELPDPVIPEGWVWRRLDLWLTCGRCRHVVNQGEPALRKKDEVVCHVCALMRPPGPAPKAKPPALSPCPKCGGPADRRKGANADDLLDTRCPACLTYCCGSYHPTPEKADACWERRCIRDAQTKADEEAAETLRRKDAEAEGALPAGIKPRKGWTWRKWKGPAIGAFPKSEYVCAWPHTDSGGIYGCGTPIPFNDYRMVKDGSPFYHRCRRCEEQLQKKEEAKSALPPSLRPRKGWTWRKAESGERLFPCFQIETRGCGTQIPVSEYRMVYDGDSFQHRCRKCEEKLQMKEAKQQAAKAVAKPATTPKEKTMKKLDETCPLCGGEVQQRYTLEDRVLSISKTRKLPLLVSCASRDCGWNERRKMPKKQKPLPAMPGPGELATESFAKELLRQFRPPLRTRLYRWCRWNAMVFGAGGVFHKLFWDDAARALGRAVEWVAMLAGN